MKLHRDPLDWRKNFSFNPLEWLEIIISIRYFHSSFTFSALIPPNEPSSSCSPSRFASSDSFFRLAGQGGGLIVFTWPAWLEYLRHVLKTRLWIFHSGVSRVEILVLLCLCPFLDVDIGQWEFVFHVQRGVIAYTRKSRTSYAHFSTLAIHDDDLTFVWCLRHSFFLRRSFVVCCLWEEIGRGIFIFNFNPMWALRRFHLY